ncbi:unnamed protein product [Euphydryas editha]|uniref:Uncharacterized protein n=1 Tax=Euphydryas editha TaxID=104508 RepID=A0AAU9V7G3_EUPED|nr:unnamed protein product [Euphydryas editha]
MATASHWNSKNAILQDLSVAQGREVPVEIVNPLTCNEKPPALNYTEETEEEFYAGCVGGADLEAGPDLRLIKQMLDMVREVNVTDNDDITLNKPDTMVEISKVDTCLGSRSKEDEHVLKLHNDTETVVQKPKKKRNVAVASLIETYGDNKYMNENDFKQLQCPKLLKPDDFVSTVKSVESNKKDVLISSKIPTIYSPTSMFRKKSKNAKNPDKTIVVQNKDSTMINNENIVINKDQPGCFVPSSYANERYMAYLEKRKVLEQVKEDVWAKAERQMKEIDAKRKNEILQLNTSLSSHEDFKSSEVTGMDFVRLPQHRHLLTGDCKVCEVLCTHRKVVEKTTDLQENSNYNLI